MREQALVENVRSKQMQCLAVPNRDNISDALAVRHPTQQRLALKFDLAGVADQHYAIAERLVEQDRKSYNGNWVEDRRSHFSDEHGALVECDKDAEWSDDDRANEDEDNAACCHGVCVKQIRCVQARFGELREECLSLLRKLRAVRREKGYLPVHGLLLVMSDDSDGNGNHDVEEAHILGHVSFSPFDFSCIHMQPASCPNDDGSIAADIVVVDGTALLQTMTKLLYGLASRTSICLGTAEYKAVSLGRIHILRDTKQKLMELRTGVHGVAGLARQGGGEVHTSDEEDELSKRNGLLKRALGVVQAKKKAKAAKASTAKTRASAPAAQRRPRARAVGQQAVDEQVDEEIAERWADAVEDDLGLVMQPQPSEPSSSSARCPVSKPEQPSFPKQVPWKDEKGYVFVMVQRDGEEMRQKHLGSVV